MAVALGAVAVALFAVLAIFGTQAFGQLVQALFSQAGGSIGSWVGDHVAGAIDGVKAWAARAFDTAISPLATFLALIVNLWEGVWTRSAQTAAAGVEAVQAVATVTVPRLERDLVHDVTSVRGDLESAVSTVALRVRDVAEAVDRDIPIVEAAIVGDTARAEAYALGVAQAVGAAGTAALAAAEGELVASIADASTYAREYADLVGREVSTAASANLAAASGSLADAIAAARQKAVAEAEAYAEGIAAAGVGALDGDAARAIAGAWGDITGAAARAADAAKGMAGRLPGDLGRIGAAAPAGVAAAIGALTAAVATTMDATADCTIPNCRNLSQYGRDLQSLLSGLEGGALIALFIGMATDPAATSAIVRDPLDAMIDPVTSAVESLVGA